MSCDGVFVAIAASADAFAAAAAFAARSRVRLSSSFMTASWRFCSSSASSRSEETHTHVTFGAVYRPSGRTCVALNEVVIDLRQIHLNGIGQRDGFFLTLLTTWSGSRSRCGCFLAFRGLLFRRFGRGLLVLRRLSLQLAHVLAERKELIHERLHGACDRLLDL